MNIKQTKFWRFFSSIKLAIWLLAFIAFFSLIGTLIPQNKEPAEYITRYGHPIYNLFLKLGLTNLYSSWWFILFLVLLSLNLMVCLCNRFSLKMRALGSIMSHISVLVILAGALAGMLFGEKGYIRIREGQSINSFMSKGRQVNLDFSFKLDDFIYEENIDSKEKLLVYSRDGRLLDEISTEVGTEAEIAKTSFKVKILRYLPDFAMDIATKEVATRSFEPRNPAIEVELKSKDGTVKTFWVFAAYPDIHKQIEKNFSFKYRWVQRRPKDFISKVTVIKDGREAARQDIRVNAPLRFAGYTFFQSSYDQEHLNWSGLQVVKDPGVPMVYAGFLLLVMGLVMIFYINPLIQRGK